jgi:hypothetical protein
MCLGTPPAVPVRTRLLDPAQRECLDRAKAETIM